MMNICILLKILMIFLNNNFSVHGSTVTSMFPVTEVIVTEDAALVWYIEPSKGKEVKTVVLHKETMNGPVLWYNQMENTADMPEAEESSMKLKQLFGERVTVSWTPLVNWISLRINNVRFNDSMTFVLRVSFKKKEDVLAYEFDSQPIKLEIKGLKLIGDGLASIYRFDEGVQPTFSILIVARKPPEIVWMFGGVPDIGDSKMEESSKDLWLYKYSCTLNALKAEDCGKNLVYRTKSGKDVIYKGITNKNQKSKIIVLFTPDKVEGLTFHGMNVAGSYCERFNWEAVEAGQCGDRLTYTVEIMNGTELLTFGNIANTFFRICNTNAATKLSVYAVFEDKSGPPASIDLYEKPPEPATCPAPPPPIVEIEYIGGFQLWHLIVMLIVGFVLAVIIETIIVVIYIKKKYPSKESTEEPVEENENEPAQV